MEEWVEKDVQFLADISAIEESEALVAKPVPQVQCLRLTSAEYQRAHEVDCACRFLKGIWFYFIVTYMIYVGAVPTWFKRYCG